MTTRSSSSSSSSSETEETTTGIGNVSGTSEDIYQTTSHHRGDSSTASQRSAVATGTPYDTVSIATTANTNFTNTANITPNASTSHQQIGGGGGGISVSQPPVLQQQQPSGIGGLSSTYSGGSSSGLGNVPLQQQQHFGTNQNSAISQQKFQQTAQTGNQTSGQFHYQQAQFANQIPGQQVFNELLGADAFKDVILNIDYGVIEAYNIGLQSAGDITGGQPQGGFDAAQTIFKQADTNQHWAQGNQQNVGGQSYSNYQAASTTNHGNNFNHAQLYTNGNPEVATILQQSGLGQGFANYQ